MAVVAAALWEDISVQFDVPLSHPAMVVTTALLCTVMLFDFVIVCVSGGLSDGFDDGRTFEPAKAGAASRRNCRACKSYATSPCGVADSVSTVAVLVSLVHLVVLEGAEAAVEEMCSPELQAVTSSLVSTPLAMFGFGVADPHKAYAADAAVQILSAMLSSAKVLKIFVKLRFPIVKALAVCQPQTKARPRTAATSSSSSRANGINNNNNHNNNNGTRQPAAAAATQSPQPAAASVTEKKLSNKMNMFLASTT